MRAPTVGFLAAMSLAVPAHAAPAFATPAPSAPARPEPPSAPRAQVAPHDPPAASNAISWAPFSVTSRGLLVQYERRLGSAYSGVLGLGYRRGANGDYVSNSWDLHSELRWWFVGRDGVSGVEGMAGWFVGASLDLGRTSLHDRLLDRHAGTGYTLTEGLRFGHRFVIFGFQAITPALSFDAIHQFDGEGRLAANTKWAPGFALTVGWLF